MTRDLRQRYAEAISDPGAFLPREPGETVPNWSSRAVMAVRDDELEDARDDARTLELKIRDEIRHSNAAYEKLSAAERTLAKVRELHRPFTSGQERWCEACSPKANDDGERRLVITPYPCPTIAALDGDGHE